jgi:hypothetical protein
MFYETFVEKIKTYFLSIAFSENLAVYEIMWESIIEPVEITNKMQPCKIIYYSRIY